METNPEQWVDSFAAAGASLFTFHIEATGKHSEMTTGFILHRSRFSNHLAQSLFSPNASCFVILDNASKLIDRIQATGMKVGISLKPKTEIETIIDLIPRLDQVLIMTVGELIGNLLRNQQSYIKLY